MKLIKFIVNGDEIKYFEVFGRYILVGKSGDSLSKMLKDMPTSVNHIIKICDD